MLLFAAALGLSSCGQDLSRNRTADETPIELTISQGARTETVSEDSIFGDLLNEPDALNEDNVPAPEAWHTISYDRGHAMSVKVNNCAHLDLLEIVVYDEVDLQGRPDGYHYVPVCGAESGKDCGGSATVPGYLSPK